MDQEPKTNTDVENPKDLNAQSEIQISKVRTEYGLNKERHACLKCKQCAIAHQAKSAAFPSGILLRSSGTPQDFLKNSDVVYFFEKFWLEKGAFNNYVDKNLAISKSISIIVHCHGQDQEGLLFTFCPRYVKCPHLSTQVGRGSQLVKVWFTQLLNAPKLEIAGTYGISF